MSGSPILEVRALFKHFTAGRSGLWSRGAEIVHAVDGVSLTLGEGEVVALVGESGSGKSTLALTLLGLEEATEGAIFFDGRDVTHLPSAARKTMRRQIQIIFQDPYESLNPLMTVGELVAEPLKIHGLARDHSEREARVCLALESCGLRPAATFVDRRPHELSGGQRQRVAIAAALVMEPRVLLADEPVSMLDVSVRAEILNLLSDLRAEKGISVLYITHDLATAAYYADRVAVMYLGRIVESGSTQQVLRQPAHPYTQALLSVIPVPNPRERRERLILQGDPPNPVDIPPGCRFHPRCPLAFDRCTKVDPGLVEVEPRHGAACLLIGEEPYPSTWQP